MAVRARHLTTTHRARLTRPVGRAHPQQKDHVMTDDPGFDQVADQLRTTMRTAVEQITTAWQGLRAAFEPILPLIRRRAALLEARRAHRADGYRDPYVDQRPPSGCAACGRPERHHGRIWHRSRAEFGGHIRPDQSTILVRMQVRRAERKHRRFGQ